MYKKYTLNCPHLEYIYLFSKVWNVQEIYISGTFHYSIVRNKQEINIKSIPTNRE